MASLLLAVIYLVFISLGLPDSLLGSAWPVMQGVFNVPSSYAGFIYMAIAFMTIISALVSPKVIKRFETKWIISFSVFLSVIGLAGFSFCSEYWMLFIFAVPYGLGAGAIDSAVNHYVANNFSGSVMNFLHCFYGMGAVISPNIMALALKYARWNEGYRWVSFIQLGILFICILSFPLWKKNSTTENEEKNQSAGIRKTLLRPGVIFTMIAFFSYCAGEATCFLWTSSYFAGTKSGISEEVIASFGSLIFAGLMIGRIISGIVSNKAGDRLLIRAGFIIELFGIILIIIPASNYYYAVAGFIISGCGMGPVYPAIQHMAPVNFGKKYSASVIGLQMASAYTGTTFMPMIFGHLQQIFGIFIMPYYVLLFSLLNIFFLEVTFKAVDKNFEEK